MATSSRAAPKQVQKLGSQSESAEEVPVKKSSMKLWIILGVLLLLIGSGAGGWYFFSKKNADNAAPVKKNVPPVFVALDPAFTVNLQPDPAEHFLQVSITLQVASKEEVELLKLHMPQVRSRLLMLLSSKKASEIATVEGKNKLAQEIAEQVNQPFAPQAAPQSVSNVFFTSFVIQ